MPPKVVHISTVHSPHDPRIYHKQCRTLARAGFDVTLIIPRDCNDFQPRDGVKVILLPRPASRKERFTKTRALAFQHAVQLDADIYHIHDPELLLLARKLNRKDNIVIYDIHEDYETAMGQKEYVPKFLVSAFSLAYRMVTTFLARGLEICLAEKYYIEKFPRGRCILNYPLLSPNKPAETKESQEHHRLLYTGNVTLERGAFIHAKLVQLDDTIAVDYIGKCSRSVASQIFAFTCNERINIIGLDQYIPHEEIESAYFNQQWLAGLALFPPTKHYQKKELTKFFEYMYAEIPVLCSNFPIWKQFVEKYDCGIAVDPYDDGAICRAISYLKKNPQRAAEMGRNGRKAVLKELNWDREGAKLVDWYRRLLGLEEEYYPGAKMS